MVFLDCRLEERTIEWWEELVGNSENLVKLFLSLFLLIKIVEKRFTDEGPFLRICNRVRLLDSRERVIELEEEELRRRVLVREREELARESERRRVERRNQ